MNVTDDRRQIDRRQTDRQTDGRRHIANVNVSSRSLKMNAFADYIHCPKNDNLADFSITCKLSP